ncbi:MAG TPA: hypothetical protein VGU44_02835, partial [Gammaproteobacteria bacterium]|nr:hypothetical protein [Gammaproteobacteria bacterium]
MYGPIHFCIIRTKANFDHARSIAKASGESFHNEKFSEDSHTQENLKNDVKHTLKTENEYGDAGFSINDEIFEIISSKYSYIDLDDMDVFEKYIKNFERINIEIKKNLNLRAHLSTDIYNKYLGDIQALPGNFCERIEQKFLSKKDKLQDFMTRVKKN